MEPVSMQELTSDPIEPVDYALVYATCLQAAATLVSAAIIANRPPNKIYSAADLIVEANTLMVEALVAGKRHWNEGAITLEPEPAQDSPIRKSLRNWTELLEAAESFLLTYAGPNPSGNVRRLRDAVAALREGNPRIDPS